MPVWALNAVSMAPSSPAPRAPDSKLGEKWFPCSARQRHAVETVLHGFAAAAALGDPPTAATYLNLGNFCLKAAEADFPGSCRFWGEFSSIVKLKED